MATTEKSEEGLSRRNFIQATVALAVGVGAGAPVLSWAEGNALVRGIDARKLAAIKVADLQKVTFTALATHPCLEANQSCGDDERRKWAEVMSAVFPESLDLLQRVRWVKRDESKQNYVFASDAAKLRLATAHLFAISRDEAWPYKDSVSQYFKFIANAPFEEAYLTRTSPHELLDSFFNNGGEDLGLLVGGERSMDAHARAWEKENGIKLKGGTTLEGVSILLSINVPELYSYELGGVRVALQRRACQPRQIVPHGKGLLDAAMMQGAIRAKYKAMDGDKGQWQKALCENLRADLKADAKLSGRIEALELMDTRKAIPDEAFLDAVLDIASESLTARAYLEDLKFINGSHFVNLLLDSSLLDPSDNVQYPGYQKRPRTKVTAAVNAVLAVKGGVVAKVMGDTDLEARYKKLADSFLQESEVSANVLAAVNEVFQGIFNALGGRREEFLAALKKNQDAPETDPRTQQARNVSRNREDYLLNMAPLRRPDFVQSVNDGFMALEKTVESR